MELELPEGTPDFNPDMIRIRPSAGEPVQETSRRTTVEGGLPTVHESALDGRLSNGSIKLDDLPAEHLAAAQQQQQLGLQVPLYLCLPTCLQCLRLTAEASTLCPVGPCGCSESYQHFKPQQHANWHYAQCSH